MWTFYERQIRNITLTNNVDIGGFNLDLDNHIYRPI